jgi:hypothetical protein
MEDFEQQLRNALARKPEPLAFEAKIFAALARQKTGRSAIWRWTAEAAAVVVIASGFWLQHQHGERERVAGELAKARLQLALRITVTELSKIQRTVRTSTEKE